MVPLSIIVFAIASGIYFLLSIGKVLFPLYVILSSIIVMHGYFLLDEIALTTLLLLFITMDAAMKMKGKLLPVYLVINLVFSFTLTTIKSGQMFELIILSLFFSFLILKMNQMVDERSEQREIYDQLLGEYRILKRMNLAAEQNARLEERTKVARDIHDSVGHRLTALIMKLEMLAIENKHSGYDKLKEMAEESLNETRQAVKALKTEDNEGIATVIHLIRKLEAESNILVQFTIKQGILSVQLSNEKSVVLYRVIQEALTNAMRHAQSREVHVTIGKSATEAISFKITNAIHDEKPFVYGFGLTNMKKRVGEVNGNLDVYQTDKQFVVTGTIPNA
ncbi:sensor histidine kinase [Virgibacillus salidurans]|uniref:sensor histidine kinase n=1 Tax=Virgibacillus salidurans TaxID=2831673 RepID=UPI001F298905|nr:sensor histidine kinase [Virgibacillus sp. NKC19-16]